MKRHTVLIDARIRQTSTGRYTDRLINHLQRLPADDYKFIIALKEGDKWKPESKNFEVFYTNIPIFPNNIFSHIRWADQVKKFQPDLVHYTLTPTNPIFGSPKFLSTTHDLTLFNYSSGGKLPKPIHFLRLSAYKFLFWKTHRDASWIITPTQYVADAVNKKYLFTNRKTSVTLEASEPALSVEAKMPAVNPGRFIMHTGNMFVHKNLERLVLAFGVLKEQHPELKLVLAGKREYHSKKLEKWAKRFDYFEDIIFTGFIPDEELKWYYENALSYVFPSLSEGFGLPGLEAMVHGCPVVSSNATCLPEVHGDAAHYFNPEDIQEMAHAINDVITDTRLRNKLVDLGYKNVKRFSWSKMAKETFAIYDQVLKDAK